MKNKKTHAYMATQENVKSVGNSRIITVKEHPTNTTTSTEEYDGWMYDNWRDAC